MFGHLNLNYKISSFMLNLTYKDRLKPIHSKHVYNINGEDVLFHKDVNILCRNISSRKKNKNKK